MLKYPMYTVFSITSNQIKSWPLEAASIESQSKSKQYWPLKASRHWPLKASQHWLLKTSQHWPLKAASIDH